MITTKPQASERTALYRYLAADGQPLYIGITRHLKNRKTAHARSLWAKEAASFTVEWYDTEAEAAAAETAAIRAERPTYNDADNFDHVPDTWSAWPQLTSEGRLKASKLAAIIQAEIDDGVWLANHKIPSASVMAQAVGIGEGATKTAIGMLENADSIYRYKRFGYFVSSGQRRDSWHHRPRRQCPAPSLE
ncbi:GIY-YIG nuclease family protein [Streptomyces sp. NPDC059786]|uniref:GIY-YIG nuclease family protein n=1 Tax=Streptomyces sp. NPDC059786 TaxID=3346946 RepID=UPI00365EC6F0